MKQEQELPLVSILVPVFNAREFLRESLDSILAQTYPRTEVLVMDDASTDGTDEIARSYGDALIYHRQPQTRGAFGNINDGIALATGELIAVYHADDVYRPEIVEREVGFLREHPEAGAVFASDIFINRDGQAFGRLDLPPELRGGGPFDYPTIVNCLLTYKNAFLRCPSSMVRASVYADVGGYRDEYEETSDLEMWLRIARSYPLGILEEHLFFYRRGHSSMYERYDHLRAEPERYFLVMDEHLADANRVTVTPDALAAYRAHRAEDRLLIAVTQYIRGDREQALRVMREIRAGDFARSRRVQRVRLLVLLGAMRLLVRLPRSALVAGLFYRRWHKLPDARRRRAASARPS